MIKIIRENDSIRLLGAVLKEDGTANASCKVSIYMGSNFIGTTISRIDGVYEFNFTNLELLPGEYVIKTYGNSRVLDENNERFTIDNENSIDFDHIPPENTVVAMLNQII